MQVITEILGNAKTRNLEDKKVDFLPVEWFETTRKVLRKYSDAGKEIGLRILKENFRLRHMDILLETDSEILLVQIQAADAVVVQPKTMREMGTICFEIGNQHIPIFIENDEVIIPYEDPIYSRLLQNGYAPIKGKRIFEDMLKASAEHSEPISVSHKKIDTEQLFSKILPKK